MWGDVKVKRLAIVSSYSENCGNASYTHVLRNAFSEHVHTDVLPLDLFLLQKTSPLFRKKGDRHIASIAEALKGYDYVNIQFEAGLYGAKFGDIRRRMLRLMQAAPNLILTMHRVDPLQTSLSQSFGDAVRQRSVGQFLRALWFKRSEQLYYDIIANARRLSRGKNVAIAVHTKRERRLIKEVYEFGNCFDYPLTFLNDGERQRVLEESDRDAFVKRHRFSPASKIVGVFGYISDYKGFETAVSALRHLPDDHVVAFFGSQHPQSIVAWKRIDEYLSKLLDHIDDTAAKHVAVRIARARKLRGRGLDGEAAKELINFSLLNRIRFVGTLSDPEFIEALRCCDAVVLPYMEVGQSMSGVVALAMESGARMICSNNLSFAEVRKYYGDCFASFDMGNDVELAQKIQLGPGEFTAERDKVYGNFSITKSVEKYLAEFGHRT